MRSQLDVVSDMWVQFTKQFPTMYMTSMNHMNHLNHTLV